MRLKRLELSGFKSFAKNAVFDFPRPITAIVGPNGSGKSNVTESIRWVLGEQSLKSLRGKKGEDLIFNGSQSVSRMGKASVALYFDNSSRQFPVEFDEVVIGRRIYRDGQNEYLLNGSIVRLKDIVELLGNVGFGISQHHIIGQGEADRILYSSPKERQAAIEDALGLRVYQFKRIEAERKLNKTEENMRQAQALQKEIKPHLKHLERMVEKYKQSAEIKKLLKEALNEYLSRFKSFVDKSVSDLSVKKSKPLTELAEIEKSIAKIQKKLTDFEKIEETPQELKEIEEDLSRLRENKTKIERDLGRLEGMLEAISSSSSDSGEVVSKEDVEDLLSSLEDSLSSAMDTDVVEEIYSIIQETLSRISGFLRGFLPREESGGNIDELNKKKKQAESTLLRLKEEEETALKKKEKLNVSFFAASSERRLAQKEFFDLESKANNLKGQVGSFELREQETKLRLSEFEREAEEAKRMFGEINIKPENLEPFTVSDLEKARKDIDRLKFRLEEAGGVDSEVIKEYEEIKEREDFFTRELEDLGSAAKSLRRISKELSEKIEEDFNKGIERINKEFQRFFETMFGGGRAKMIVVRSVRGAKIDTEELEDDVDAVNESAVEDKSNKDPSSVEILTKEGGLDIEVALPRKKIKGLDMLSGGERALTSIALLFAISSVNPPPFLVLDETDSALDEANSRRYTEMLKQLSLATQIITVTHNRETMRQAGALYGVTMSSDGVSRMLSLKLSEAEEIAQ